MLLVLTSGCGEVGDLLLQGLIKYLLIHLKMAVEHSEYLILERGLEALEAGQKRPGKRVVLSRVLKLFIKCNSPLA